MATCKNCNTQVADGVKFCPSCGKDVNAAAPAAQQADPSDVQENKGMAILAYLLFFVPLLAGTHKKSAFVKYHTNQGTVLFLAAIAVSIALSILSAIISAILTATMSWNALLAFASIFGIIWTVYGIAVTVLAVIGILNVVNGRMKPLPLIGKFNIIK